MWYAILFLLLLLGAASPAASQANPQAQGEPGKGATSSGQKPAEKLYLELHNVGLNPDRAYLIREGSIDRPGLHVTFEDGLIAFTQDVAGKITGAFFEGEGEVLVVPPNHVERASMALFTGTAILEDRFSTAYFRFNDDTFKELQPYLRANAEARDFALRWTETAKNLASVDALRLFVSFSHLLPTADGNTASVLSEKDSGDHYLHCRIEGPLLGAYDIYYDTTASEQIVAGQTKVVAGSTYYNIWTSFSMGDVEVAKGLRKEKPVPDEIELQRYEIKTQVNPPTSVSVDATVTMKMMRGGSRTLLFELSRFLQVKQAEANGRAVEFINNPSLDGTRLAKQGNDQVAVVFPETLREGQVLKLRFTYGGDVLSEAGGGLLYVGARGAWYPNRGLQPCAFDLEFRYPAEWKLVATGKRTEAGTADEGLDTARGETHSKWVSEQPIALAGFNLGKYEKATARAGNIEVETYAARGVEKSFPRMSGPVVQAPDMRGLSPTPASPVVREMVDPSPARNAQGVANEAASALEFFSQRLGPYPYGSLELTQMPGPASQGWPGLIFLSSMSFLSPGEESSLRMTEIHGILRRLMLPHETAHQWWGDLVLWKSYRDQWLVEALANYCALMKLETESPAQFREVLEKYRADLLEKNKDGEELASAGPVTLGQRLSSSHFPTGYEAISYGRGTWLFHMLRHMLVDASQASGGKSVRTPEEDPFVRALRKICERYAMKAVSTEEVMSVFAEDLPPSLHYEGHKSLDWFFTSWVQGTALPHFSVRNVKFMPKGGGTIVSGVIVQKDAPADLITSVPVYAVIGSKNVLLGRVFADSPETAFHLTTNVRASKIVLDPNGTLLTSRR